MQLWRQGNSSTWWVPVFHQTVADDGDSFWTLQTEGGLQQCWWINLMVHQFNWMAILLASGLNKSCITCVSHLLSLLWLWIASGKFDRLLTHGRTKLYLPSLLDAFDVLISKWAHGSTSKPALDTSSVLTSHGLLEMNTTLLLMQQAVSCMI